jgi:hypothetical protein
MSSVKLGVCVLLSCALFFALSTIFWQEPEVIVKHVPLVKYGFEVILVFLSLNLLAVTLSRYPWNRLKIGMLTTHAGLIVTFAGAFITCRWGVDGMITLDEGKSTKRYFTGRDMLSLKTIGAGHQTVPYMDFPVRLIGMTKSTERRIVEDLPDGSRVTIDKYYPRFKSEHVIRDAGAPPDGAPPQPAVELRISHDGRHRDNVLPAFSQVSLIDRFVLLYAPEIDDAMRASIMEPRPPMRSGTLVVTPRGKDAVKHEVADLLGQPVEIGEGYSLTIEKYLPALVVGVDNKAVSADAFPSNPSIQIRVTDGKGFDKTEWLFVDKEAPEMTGRIGLNELFSFSYEFGNRFTAIYFLGKDGVTEAVLSAPGAAPRTFGHREEVPLEDGATVKALRTLKHMIEVEEATNDAPDKSPAIHVIWEGAGGRDEAWLPFGATSQMTVGSTTLLFQYTQVQAALPFEIGLKDFRLQRYEGTEAASSFESLVWWKDGDGKGETVISMNNPLKIDRDWGTWKVFQTSYDPRTEATSTFSVSYDPGRPIVYAGFIAVCSGVFFMFWVKPILRSRMAKGKAA